MNYEQILMAATIFLTLIGLAYYLVNLKCLFKKRKKKSGFLSNGYSLGWYLHL